MNSRLQARARSDVSGNNVERDGSTAGVEFSLVIYGSLAGSLAVGLGYLALRLLGSPGIVVPIAFIILAGWLADPVLQRVRSSSGGA
jgi:hypothetical protein